MKKIIVIFCFILLSAGLLSQEFCLDFDGVDDYAEIADTPGLNPTTSITVEAWVKLDGMGDLPTIVGKDDWTASESGYVLRIDNYSNVNTPQFQIGSYGWFSVNASQGDIPVGEWTHVAGTFDGSTLKIYINGVEAGSSYFSGSIVTSSCNFYIGGHWNNYVNRQWNGMIDEVRVWDICRTESEISENMENPLTGAETGLVGLWRMQEGAGTTAFDLTANAFDGTVYGALWDEGYPMASDTGTASGLVLDAVTMLPIQNAVITIGEDDTITDESGNYSLEVPPGTYQLTCEHSDYELYTHPDDVIVIENETVTIDFSMTPLVQIGTVAGTVTDQLTSQLVHNATITLGEYQTQSDESGVFLLELPAGIYQMTCEHEDYETYVYPDDVVVEANQVVEIEIFLVPLVGSDNIMLPHFAQLNGNYPNPFNPETMITFYTTESSVRTELVIYNIKGQIVKALISSVLRNGFHQVVWNGTDDKGSDVTSGIYLLQMKSGDYWQTNRMVLMK
jgi:Concanavalin A-like lectin/glucanases superfamily/Carboxypeptidase regulatory-like domain/FlgD Ig-like domain